MAHTMTMTDALAASRPGGPFARLRAALAARRKFALIRDELNRLNERELADLGLSRLNVRDVARQAVYGR